MEKTPEYEPDRYDRFPGNYLKVKFNNNFRLIFTRKELKINSNDIRIYVALCILKRGDNEYTKFKDAKTREKKRDIITGKNSLDWDEYI